MSNQQYELVTPAASELDTGEADVVIVGGGPIGLAHAWGLKAMNKDLKYPFDIAG